MTAGLPDQICNFLFRAFSENDLCRRIILKIKQNNSLLYLIVLSFRYISHHESQIKITGLHAHIMLLTDLQHILPAYWYFVWILLYIASISKPAATAP